MLASRDQQRLRWEPTAARSWQVTAVALGALPLCISIAWHGLQRERPTKPFPQEPSLSSCRRPSQLLLTRINPYLGRDGKSEQRQVCTMSRNSLGANTSTLSPQA